MGDNIKIHSITTFATVCVFGGGAYCIYKYFTKRQVEWFRGGKRGWTRCEQHLEEALETGFQSDEAQPHVLTRDGYEIYVDFQSWNCHLFDSEQKFAIRRCGHKPELLKPRESKVSSPRRRTSRNETNFGDYDTPYRDTPGKFPETVIASNYEPRHTIPDLDDVSSMTSVPPITSRTGRHGMVSRNTQIFQMGLGELSRDLGPATKPYTRCVNCRHGFVDTSFPCGHSYCTKCAVHLPCCILCAPTEQVEWLSELHSEWGEDVCRLCADRTVECAFKRCGCEFCLECMSRVKECPVCSYSKPQAVSPPICHPQDSMVEGSRCKECQLAPVEIQFACGHWFCKDCTPQLSHCAVCRAKKSSDRFHTSIEGEAGERSIRRSDSNPFSIPSPVPMSYEFDANGVYSRSSEETSTKKNHFLRRKHSSFSPGDVTNLVASIDANNKVNKIEAVSENGIVVFHDIKCGSSVAPKPDAASTTEV